MATADRSRQEQIILGKIEERMQQMKHDLGEQINQQSILIYHMYSLALQFGKGPTVPPQSTVLLNQETNVDTKHTIAAHNLLAWPAIRALLPQQYNREYVMDLEGKRGLFQVYGQDESNGANPQQGQELNMLNLHLLASPDDTFITGCDATSGDSLSFETVEQGITENGILTTDPDTVRSLHLRYMDRLHRVHPFLGEKDLKNKVETFIGTYCFVGRLNTTGNHRKQGTKRRRLSPTSYSKPLTRSVNNAVVLLVLALGSICECRNYPLPTSVPQGHCKKKNVFPGLDYYRFAAQILGVFQGGHDLLHVQAGLLAGLYADQLAHPCQSHGWIYQASRACQVLLQSCGLLPSLENKHC